MKHLRLFLLTLVAMLCPSAFAQSGFDYELDEENPMITNVNQLSSPWNAPHDFEGNLADSAVKNALRGLRDEARNMKILGNY